MPAKTRISKGAFRASKAANAATSNPYIRRIIEDEDLRQNMMNAIGAARDAYKRMSNGKGPAKAISEDKKLQRDLRETAESLRAASDQIRGVRSRKKRKGGLRKVLFLALIGAGLALIFSEDARSAVMDRLFGSEEEFEYTPVTTPSDNGA